jgi:hypothetical protein
MGPKLVIPECEYGVNFNDDVDVEHMDASQLFRFFQTQVVNGRSIVRFNLETNLLHVGLAPNYTIQDFVDVCFVLVLNPSCILTL